MKCLFKVCQEMKLNSVIFCCCNLHSNEQEKPNKSATYKHKSEKNTLQTHHTHKHNNFIMNHSTATQSSS